MTGIEILMVVIGFVGRLVVMVDRRLVYQFTRGRHLTTQTVSELHAGASGQQRLGQIVFGLPHQHRRLARGGCGKGSEVLSAQHQALGFPL